MTFDQFAAFVQETDHDVGSECLTLEDGRDKVRTGRLWRNSGFSHLHQLERQGLRGMAFAQGR